MVTAGARVVVAEYMQGQQAGGGTGDPAMTIAVPLKQYRTDYLSTPRPTTRARSSTSRADPRLQAQARSPRKRPHLPTRPDFRKQGRFAWLATGSDRGPWSRAGPARQAAPPVVILGAYGAARRLDEPVDRAAVLGDADGGARV
ncbi:hypothetical protein [Nannocystis pusilla]|uniref:hypothetical protein n=1 Tax=Nannocystis pusilla TaxID=889268 RepID=UPI003B7DA77C